MSRASVVSVPDGLLKGSVWVTRSVPPPLMGPAVVVPMDAANPESQRSSGCTVGVQV